MIWISKLHHRRMAGAIGRQESRIVRVSPVAGAVVTERRTAPRAEGLEPLSDPRHRTGR
jgi:hypothetical protein